MSWSVAWSIAWSHRPHIPRRYRLISPNLPLTTAAQWSAQ